EGGASGLERLLDGLVGGEGEHANLAGQVVLHDDGDEPLRVELEGERIGHRGRNSNSLCSRLMRTRQLVAVALVAAIAVVAVACKKPGKAGDACKKEWATDCTDK